MPGLPQELKHFVERQAAMTTRGANASHPSLVAPAFQRRLADVDGLGYLLGGEELLHGSLFHGRRDT